MEHVEQKGARVPAIGLGTWKLQGADCYDAVTHALSIGYRHIDTAQAYANEEQVGQGMADAAVPRSEVWLTTKVWVDNAAREDVRPAVQGSLRRLGTGYVDLLLLHWPAPDVAVTETLGAMSELVDEGLTRYVGVSNFPSAYVREAETAADVLTNQVEYHPYLSQEAVLAEAERDGHSVTAYSPLAHGGVTNDRTIRQVAAGYGKTPAQVTLRWLIQQPRVVAIPRSVHRLRHAENLDVFDFELSDDDMKTMASLAGPDGRLIDPSFAPPWD
jgi:diketogulonate reductase-like aldo/keto reductase